MILVVNLREDLNVQEVRLCTVECSVSGIDESVSIKVSVAVQESVANVNKKIKNEVEQLMKIQPCVSKQMAEQIISCLLYTSRCV